MKVFVKMKKKKKTRDVNTNNKNIKPGYRNVMWKEKKYSSAHNEKWEKNISGGNRATKLGKLLIICREGKNTITCEFWTQKLSKKRLLK